MDQSLRNALQRTTQQIRTLLEGEYTDQLAGTYDIRRGEPIPDRPGIHLRDPAQRFVRRRLVEAVQHKLAAGRERDLAIDDYTREAAFTTLNRFVALKMLEARALVQECVSRGEQSGGYREFTGLAPELPLLPDGSGYRLYLECLFDEIGTGIKVLFDRRDPASLLWPRRQALLDLLEALNSAELTDAWGQDETIGWVYQYFNSEQERRRMRDESQAPRDSHELAVRNQFFTPRYVVEFLSDNTLGRTWYEMRKGQTRLAEQCRYLVRRPTEVFLDEGQEAPPQETKDDLSQEEVLREPVHIPHHAKKDPRDLKILDPACGSGHFLLYCFDLLGTIYEEAWADEQSPPSEATGKSLQEDYPSVEALCNELPGLILRHNLWGVDIDPRCAQIAAFALWMRTQRAFNDLGLSRTDRPVIRRTNIVVAEPMPGQEDMLDEFTATLQPPPLGRLVRYVFDRMKLAGEAGTLLKIEEEIREEIEAAKREWYIGPRVVQKNLFGPSTDQPLAQQRFDDQFVGTDEVFWCEAEERIYAALREYTRCPDEGDRYLRKLFADDAERGFAFIDVCRHRYDVVLMNPPFGEASLPSRAYLYSSLPECSRDLFAGFISRMCAMLVQEGRLGAITSRTAFFSDFLAGWRKENFMGGGGCLCLMIDLGYGVLDAVVETAAYVCCRGPVRSGLFIHALSELDKQARVTTALENLRRGFPGEGIFDRRLDEFSTFPDSRFIYHLHPTWVSMLRKQPLHPHFVSRAGLTTGDDPRYLRCFWEIKEPVGLSRWMWLAKGGEFSRYYSDIHLLVDWQAKDYLSRTRNCDLYGRAGVTYTERTTSNLSARILNQGSCFSGPGPGIIARDERYSHFLLAFMNSFIASYCLEALIGGGDYSVKGSAARHFEPGYVNHLPACFLTGQDLDWFRMQTEQLIELVDSLNEDETHPLFRGLPVYPDRLFSEALLEITRQRYRSLLRCYEIIRSLETRLTELFHLSQERVTDAYSDTGWPWPERGAVSSGLLHRFLDLDPLITDSVPEGFLNTPARYRFENKLAHYLHAGIEHLARCLAIGPEQICAVLTESSRCSSAALYRYACRLVSLLFGFVFGRWHDGSLHPEQGILGGRSIFERLPPRQPARSAIAHSLAHPEFGRRLEEHKALSPEVVVDDPGHPNDALALLRVAIACIWKEGADAIFREVIDILDPPHANSSDLRPWFRGTFFADHIKRYSKSRRKAPIFWELATPSNSYAVWLYYHCLTRDTLYKVLNEYVKQKLEHEQRKLDQLRTEVGENPTHAQREEIEPQERLVSELRMFREEVERVAPLWNPDLNDGVLINFAPLWRLVPQHREWQRECKNCWDKLVAGEYDWSHLAMHLWPERVVPKCRTDASLAIAHGLEEVFWEREAAEEDERTAPVAEDTPLLDETEEEEDDGEGEAATEREGRRRRRSAPRWVPRQDVTAAQVEKLIAERTSPAVKAALEKLLAAPSPVAARARSNGTRRRRAGRASTSQAPASGASAELNGDLLDQVRQALAGAADGVAKSAVVATTGLNASQVDAALRRLTTAGEVVKTGRGPGTRYTLQGGGGR